MRVPITWLKDFVDFYATPEELADKLTFSGMEVEEITTVGADCEGMVVAEVLSINPHPNADKLVVCEVSDGHETLQIVCGAKNFAVGDKVALAPCGITMPDGMKIKKAKLRGVASHGMLCAEDELGLSDDHSGILILDSDIPAGTALCEILGAPEIVLVIEVTPNRPDCLSMIGMAREVAALFETELRLPSNEYHETDSPVENFATVEVQDSELCPRYTARVLSGVSTARSPMWMQLRLLQGGIRPINIIVDVTNYVLLECGQPLHAFDLKLLADSRIVVRRATEGETMATLDGTERKISSDMLVIADSERPVAVAGVMGGAGSEIQDDTTDILLESACFNASSIRRTSRDLGLSTESSYRFERGVDINIADWASRRAAKILVDLNDGNAACGVIDVYPSVPEERKIDCRFARIRQLMGVEITDEEIISILSSLYLRVTPTGEGAFLVGIPTFRDDLTIEADIIEEVARIHGLDKLETRVPSAAAVSEADETAYRAGEACRASLVSLGLSETMNYSFVDAQLLDTIMAADPDTRLVLPNPVSLDYAVMRDSLVPQMLRSLGRNLAHQTAEASLFEIGRIFFKRSDGTLGEEERLCAGLMGPVGRSGFDRRRAVKPDEQFLWMKGILEALCTSLRIPLPSLESAGIAWADDGEAASLSWPGAENAGCMGLVSKKIRHEWRMNMPIAVLEVKLNALTGGVFDVPAVQPIAAYPAVARDMAIVVDESVRNDDVMSIIREISPPELTAVELFDIYADEGMGAGKRSLAYSFTYRSLTRTLTDEEANELHESVKSQIADKLNAVVRER